ncbi:uncharacterized protein LOC113498972 isoform X1 [Trichoplusia ni]|uniref:Uncharacterized protein LOC113498972 isoform X1 n=2 Tax=Trichoplusia ni TaxID=7111 RepID=A0A7E5W351_TRINI|nr:uncharacterized protein LOC113498972 isoform X1 [Trichoplusia ni]
MSDAASVMTDEMKKFSNVAKQFAENQKSNLDTASHKIQEEVPKIGHAVMKGVEAFLDALKEKPEKPGLQQQAEKLVSDAASVAKEFAENQMSNLGTASQKIQEELPKLGHAVMKGVESFLDAFKAKIVDGSKELEEKARSLFRGAEDENDISLEKFKEVIEKFAVEQKRNFEEVAQQLEKEGPTVVKAVIAGVSAFKDVMKGK